MHVESGVGDVDGEGMGEDKGEGEGDVLGFTLVQRQQVMSLLLLPSSLPCCFSSPLFGANKISSSLSCRLSANFIVFSSFTHKRANMRQLVEQRGPGI